MQTCPAVALKRHWTILKILFLTEFHFIMEKVITSKQKQKEKFKNSFRKYRNHKFLLNMHKLGMRLISIHVAV